MEEGWRAGDMSLDGQQDGGRSAKCVDPRPRRRMRGAGSLTPPRHGPQRRTSHAPSFAANVGPWPQIRPPCEEGGIRLGPRPAARRASASASASASCLPHPVHVPHFRDRLNPVRRSCSLVGPRTALFLRASTLVECSPVLMCSSSAHPTHPHPAETGSLFQTGYPLAHDMLRPLGHTAPLVVTACNGLQYQNLLYRRRGP